jgi:hypothetical protein
MAPVTESEAIMTVTLNQTIRTQFRTIDGLSIRFAESERAGDDALLLNPWPESLYAFEPTWSRLAAQLVGWRIRARMTAPARRSI